MGENKRAIGTNYEQMAADFLEQNGCRILERNFRCRQGEIDIIGKHEGYLVFVEVKYRATEDSGNAAEAVNTAKQKKICRVADYYRMKCGVGDDRPIRYDVIAIQGKEGHVDWYQNAFCHIYAGRY